MLSRDQVLHVARLARLELSEEEVGRFSEELSKVLDWVETIEELGSLDDVPPTSHVVNVENRVRERLGTKVHLRYAHGKGALEIAFFSDADLERILQILGVDAA